MELSQTATSDESKGKENFEGVLAFDNTLSLDKADVSCLFCFMV